MTLTEAIQSAIKSNKAVIGYNESLSYVKTNTPKIIIVANNLPLSIRQGIEPNAPVSNTKFEVFDGTS